MPLRRFTILYFCALAFAFTACSDGGGSNAPSSPDGVYYIEGQDFGDGTLTPETIMEIKDGMLTEYSVHNGEVVVTEREFSQNGNQMTPKTQDEQTFDCDGLPVVMEAQLDTESVRYQKIGDSLQLTVDGESFSLISAAPEDIDRIKALPRCERL